MKRLLHNTMGCPAPSNSHTPVPSKIYATETSYPPYELETEAAYLRRIKRGDTFAFVKNPPTPRHHPRVIHQAMMTAYSRVFRNSMIVNAVTAVQNIQSGMITGTIKIMTVEGSLTRTFKQGDKGWKCDVTIAHKDGSTQTFPMYSLQRCMNPVRADVYAQQSKITSVDDSGITFTAETTRKIETTVQTAAILNHAEQTLVRSYQRLQNRQIVASNGTFVKIADDQEALIIERAGLRRIASNVTGWQPILSDTKELFSGNLGSYEKKSTIYNNFKIALLKGGRLLQVNRVDSWDVEDQFYIEL